MSAESEMDIVRTKLYNVWGGATPLSPISWDGLGGSPYERQAGVGFIRPRIEDGAAETAGIGGPLVRYRKFSTLVIEVYRPAGEGQETGLQWCDTLIEGFHRYESGNVHFDARPSKFDNGQDGKFFRWSVFATYRVEELT
jgi:hypothetical protein